MRRLTVSFLLCATGFAGHAQVMLEADLIGQPLTYTKSGAVQGCGVRIVGTIAPVAGQTSFRSFDVSANFWKSGEALGKFIGETTPLSKPTLNDSRRLRLFDGWVRAEGKPSVAASDGGFQESASDKGAYLFAADPEAAMHVMLAVATGKPVQVGLRWEREQEWIYFGKVKFAPAETTQLANCIREALK